MSVIECGRRRRRRRGRRSPSAETLAVTASAVGVKQWPGANKHLFSHKALRNVAKAHVFVLMIIKGVSQI